MWLVQNVKTKQKFALKVVSNTKDKKSQKLNRQEEECLQLLSSNPCLFIMKLESVFLEGTRKCYVLEFLSGGELLTHVKRSLAINEEMARFYFSELVCAVEHLHGLSIVF